jgi:hypothetical protein
LLRFITSPEGATRTRRSPPARRRPRLRDCRSRGTGAAPG